MVAHLKVIAAALKVVSPGYVSIISLDGSLVDALAKIPGAKTHQTVYAGRVDYIPGPYVIESAEIAIDGVDFHAQRSRPATAEEAAKLDTVKPEPAIRHWVSL